MLIFFACAIIVALIYTLLRERLSPMVALTLLPLVGLLGFWGVSGLTGNKVVPSNYAYLLQDSYIQNFLSQIAPTPLPGDASERFAQAAYQALKLKPKVKNPVVNATQITQAYQAGLKTLQIQASFESALQSMLQTHSIIHSLQDHTQVLVAYFRQGVNKVFNIALMFLFAILFFGILNDVGLFNPLIRGVIALSKGNAIAICVGTCVIATLAHLDGSGASTFLVVIPPLLPIYKRLNLNPYLLVLLVAMSAGLANLLPWGGPLGRVASVLGVETSALYFSLLPLQAIGLVCVLFLAVILGWREQRRLKNTPPQALEDAPNLDLGTTRHFLANLCVALLALLAVVCKILPPELCFLIALCVALLINYPNPKARMDKIKQYAPEAISMVLILLSAGMYIGILSGSGMLQAIAKHLTDYLPASILPYLHWIVGALGVPFKLILDTNSYYFTLYPIVASLVAPIGVETQSVGYVMLVGATLGTFVSPLSPALWLGLGLAKLSMGRHIAYSFFWLWGLSLLLIGVAKLLGLL
ncbi:CitMHS family transporter [Helicobacter salomonis]|uniref:CitMHS family transporter n=1 Tax=Helicobacter salomonis TaxID=56878 RepID=UPI001F2F15D8|nr:SLC13 family permease [Helicobacter salomonis]